MKKGIIFNQRQTMTNVKNEIVKLLTNANIPLRDIQAASITYSKDIIPESEYHWIMLYPGHTDKEFDQWLSKMNEINYYAGYGAQQLFGTIWLKNGLWITRGEYDGSEWWDLHKRPPLPKRDKS